MGIAGVEAEAPSSTATADEPLFTIVTNPEDVEEDTDGAEATEEPPMDEPEEDNGECKLLGPFALLIQGALGALAVLSLVFKRYRERPRRPVKIWAFDVSKQVVGSVLLHILNLFMSMLSSGDFDMASKVNNAPSTFVQDGSQPNPCSFYLLNLAIDVSRLRCNVTDCTLANRSLDNDWHSNPGAFLEASACRGSAHATRKPS